MNLGLAEPVPVVSAQPRASASEPRPFWPVMAWAVGGAFWWWVAAALSLVASIKFHGPGFLADVPWLTYGRVRVAATQAGWWGGVIPLALGAMLGWLAWAGRTRIAFGGLAVVGAKLWHLGVLVGVLGILSGDTTGHDGWGMPLYSVWVWGSGLLLLGISALATLHRRQERGLEPPHWFLLAGLFWLAWVVSTAWVLLGLQPVRGVVQAVVDWWFLWNVQGVVGSLLGLGLLWGWVPVWTGRALYSRYYAVLTFLGLLVFTSWACVPLSAPVPAWLPVLGTVAAVLSVVPWLAAWLNWRGSTRGAGARLWQEGSGRFAVLAFASFLAAAGGKLLLHVPATGSVLEFTWWVLAQQMWQVHGWLGLAAVAALYVWLREACGLTASERAVRWHFWLAGTGLWVGAAALAVTGVIQGLAWQDASLSNVEVLKRTLMGLRLSTVGELLWWLGTWVFMGNLTVWVGRMMVVHWRRWRALALAPVEAEEGLR